VALNSEQMNKLYLAVVLGQDFDTTGFEGNDEAREFYDTMLDEVAQAPEGVTAAPIVDWLGGDYDALISASGQDGAEFDAMIDEALQTLTKSTSGMSLVSKSVEEDRFTLGPMYVPNRIDAHNEWTDPDELQKAVWDYVRKGDRRIRLQHNKDIVAGEWVEVMAFPYETTVPMTKADGGVAETTFPANTVYLGVVWEPWAWEMVKAGKLTGYSVGGKAQRIEVDLPEPEDVRKDDPTVSDVHVDTVSGSEADAEQAKGKRRKKTDIVATVDSQPMVKHPGHPDQKAHAGGKGRKSVPDIADKAPIEGRSTEAVRAATELRKRVAAVEPEITSGMVDLADKHGGEMVGLGNRLKTTDSLARKIDAEKHDKGGDVDATAASMSDVARYTISFSEDGYSAGARGVMDDLESQGCSLRSKNYWKDGDGYQGVNIAVTRPDGTTFELQFHTSASLELKAKNHKVYEEYRAISPTPANAKKRWKLFDQMARAALRCPKPPGAESPALGESKSLAFTLMNNEGKTVSVPPVRI